MPDDPKGYVGSEDFQTKDFDCFLSIYEIDSNGQLLINKTEGHYVEGDKNSKDLFGKIGHYKVTRKWSEFVFKTSEICMYDYIHSNGTEYDYFIEYKIIFIDGLIDEVQLVKFEAQNNAERKNKDEEFNKKLKDWHEFTKTRKYRYILRPYTSSVRFVFRKLSSSLKFLQSNLYKIEKFFLIK
jgi:hypothetical protein